MSSQHDEASAGRDSPAPEALTQATPAQPGQSTGDGPGAQRPWKATADGKTVFRRGTPLVIWWIWVAFAIYNLIDIVIRDDDYFSFEVTAGLLVVTGAIYACALRSRVVADGNAIFVYNPFRDHVARWGALNGVYLGDSVELHCAQPAPKKDKTIYCWALYSSRRSRLRSEHRAQRSQTRITGRVPADYDNLLTQDVVRVMAAELGRRSAEARRRGAPDAVLESRWALLPLACFLVPAVALVALLLAR